MNSQTSSSLHAPENQDNVDGELMEVFERYGKDKNSKLNCAELCRLIFERYRARISHSLAQSLMKKLGDSETSIDFAQSKALCIHLNKQWNEFARWRIPGHNRHLINYTAFSKILQANDVGSIPIYEGALFALFAERKSPEYMTFESFLNVILNLQISKNKAIFAPQAPSVTTPVTPLVNENVKSSPLNITSTISAASEMAKSDFLRLVFNLVLMMIIVVTFLKLFNNNNNNNRMNYDPVFYMK